MFLTSQMMILIKEKENCAASKGGAPELKTSMSRGCIHFCSKPLLKCCHQTAIYESCYGVLEKEENITEDFKLELFHQLTIYGRAWPIT